MQRTTVMLPADLKAKALRLARERGISLGELLRESLARAVDRPPPEGMGEDPLFADTATYAGPAPDDLSERHDDYLYGEDGAR